MDRSVRPRTAVGVPSKWANANVSAPKPVIPGSTLAPGWCQSASETFPRPDAIAARRRPEPNVHLQLA